MKTLHTTTFEYLKPTDRQIALMSGVRQATAWYADYLDFMLPSGADKTYVLRKLREIGMWANVSITREADGAPRCDGTTELDQLDLSDDTNAPAAPTS